MLDFFEQRIKSLDEQIAQIVTKYQQKDNELKQLLANHNMLLGMRNEASNIHRLMQPQREKVEKSTETMDQHLAVEPVDMGELSEQQQKTETE